MSLFEVIVLGVVQGLTEFLPVSSSGHLVLFSHILDVQDPTIAFEILVHFGTLLAIFIVFWQDIVLLVRAGLRIAKAPKELPVLWKQDPGVRMACAIVVGTLPAVVVAAFFRNEIAALFGSPITAGYMLLFTGTILFIADKLKGGEKQVEKISLKDGLIIGCGQALAIMPGISRSGTTIAVGLFRGLDRESAARFSFLLTIPAILGATVLALDDLLQGNVQTPVFNLIVGTIAATISGYLAIKLLLQIVRKGRLAWFSYYTWFVGLLVIFFNLS